MKIKFFISDVDGTLVDRMPIHARTFAELVAPFGVKPEAAQKYYYESALGSLSQEFAEILSEHNVAFAPPDLERLSSEFFERVEKEDVELFPGVGETLATLKRKNIKLCATSGSRTAPLGKRVLPLAELFVFSGNRWFARRAKMLYNFKIFSRIPEE